MTFIEKYDQEKYERLIQHIKTLEPGDTISVAYIQRKVRVGYQTGKRFIESLYKQGIVESYQHWYKISKRESVQGKIDGIKRS